ncbi:MAG: hypothetical protein AB7V77_04795 [Candidatus Woesearchaeota archaeon]
MDHNRMDKIIKIYGAHVVASTFIGIFVYLLIASHFNPNIIISPLVISMGSAGAGFYLKTMHDA